MPRGASRKKETGAKTTKRQNARSAANKVGELLEMAPAALRAALADDPLGKIQEEVVKQPDLLEAWSAQCLRALRDENYPAVGPLMLMGTSLVTLFNPADMLETNVMDSFVKWVKLLASRRRSPSVPYLGAALAVLQLLADLLEVPEYKEGHFKKLHAHLTDMVLVGRTDKPSVMVARTAAEALLTGTQGCPQNKAVLDHMRVVELFHKAADVPLMETLGIVIRTCIVNVRDSKADTSEARAKFRGYLPTEDLYTAFLYSGKTEMGINEFVLGYNELIPKFYPLRCESFHMSGRTYKAEGDEGLQVYLHKGYVTLNNPVADAAAWIDIDLADVRNSSDRGARITIELDNDQVRLTAESEREARAWYRHLSAALRGDALDLPAAPKVPKSSPAMTASVPPATTRVSGAKRPFLGSSLFDGIGDSPPSPAKRAKQSARKDTTVPADFKIRIPTDRDLGLKEVASGWEAPESLLIDSAWMQDDDSSDDEEAEMERMKHHLAETMSRQREADQKTSEEVEGIEHEVMNHLQAQMKARITEPSEEFMTALVQIKDSVNEVSAAVSEDQTRERKLTSDVVAAHGKFGQKARAVRQSIAELQAEINDVVPSNDQLMEQMDTTIETLVQKGFDVLHKKVKKKKSKSEAVVKMFHMITHEFSRRNKAI
eukprot:TRINITY_DN18586_c0_g1_i1.p1 TRINITY_DN18586_c0_g1~~TRINITY_DN18586_c0_g1_i1.p1  ORF type:complete len:674 (+),score=289.23 TRINITY_DN18586_c0_g1_i1:47-2023(+)